MEGALTAFLSSVRGVKKWKKKREELKKLYIESATFANRESRS
jgi:hypothetical protein